MTELEKLKNGKDYNPLSKDVQEALVKGVQSWNEYNNIYANDAKRAQIILINSLGYVGENVTVLPGIHYDFGFNISIGSNSFINYNATILDSAKVTIGENVFIGPSVNLYTPIHPLEWKQRNTGLEWAKPITIENNVWLGGNVTVLPGVTIHEGAVVGAGSVVTKDVAASTFVCGNPAVFKKKINN